MTAATAVTERDWSATPARDHRRERRHAGVGYQLRLLGACASWRLGAPSVMAVLMSGSAAPDEAALDAALHAYLGAATLSALGEIAGGVWRDAGYRRYADLRAAGQLHAYMRWKRDGGEGRPPAAIRGLDRHLGAAVNAADSDTLAAGIDEIRDAGARPPGMLLARWRHHGEALVFDTPELARVEPGPPRGLWRDEVLVEPVDAETPAPTAAPTAAAEA